MLNIDWTLILPVLLAIAYIIFIAKGGTQDASLDTVANIGVFIIVLAFLYLYNINDAIEGSKEKTVAGRKTFFQSLKGMTLHLETDQFAFYPPSLEEGKPMKFVFLDKHPDLLDILKDLHFLSKDWDPAGYTNLVVLLERFLQVYYRTLKQNDRTDMEMNIPVLRDMRNEIMNIVHSFVYQIPLYFKQPNKRYLNPTDKYIEKRQRYLQSFLYKKLRILTRQWYTVHMPDNLRPNPPWPGNQHGKDERYFVL